MVNKMVNKLRKKLTEKQERILGAMEEFILEHGYSPTIRQLGKLVKIPSPSAVYKHILSLEKKDHLEVEKRGAARGAYSCLRKPNI
jgi:repressor LexA